MPDHVYKKIEVVGSSKIGSDEAIKNAIAKVAASGQHLDWYEVIENRGHIVNGEIAHFQVTVKIGVRLED